MGKLFSGFSFWKTGFCFISTKLRDSLFSTTQGKNTIFQVFMSAAILCHNTTAALQRRSCATVYSALITAPNTYLLQWPLGKKNPFSTSVLPASDTSLESLLPEYSVMIYQLNTCPSHTQLLLATIWSSCTARALAATVYFLD